MSESLPSSEQNQQIKFLAYQYGTQFTLEYNPETKLLSDGYDTHTVQDIFDNLYNEDPSVLKPMQDEDKDILVKLYFNNRK